LSGQGKKMGMNLLVDTGFKLSGFGFTATKRWWQWIIIVLMYDWVHVSLLMDGNVELLRELNS
jgi:hypothetical protein